MKNKLKSIVLNYEKYILSCQTENFSGDFRLSLNSDISDYARCFAIFGLNLINSDYLKIEEYRNTLSAKLIKSLIFAAERNKGHLTEKPFLQLLCFTFSALKAIDKLEDEKLLKFVSSLKKIEFNELAEKYKFIGGKPPSGNIAMFHAIINLYLLNSGINEKQCSLFMDDWLKFHLNNINSFGFWGSDSKFTMYRNFQNGYHQWEILKYLGKIPKEIDIAAYTVSTLQDKQGHFAPYPGGGGCYDYDAVFILLLYKEVTGSSMYDKNLTKLFNQLVREQNEDGGFSETKSFIINSKPRYMKILKHLFARKTGIFIERFFESLRRMRRKHRKINTHWSLYSRDWDESNLWDSWFRMLTLLRVAMDLKILTIDEPRSIDFPGIGFINSITK